jgi:hypothetical protein
VNLDFVMKSRVRVQVQEPFVESEEVNAAE